MWIPKVLRDRRKGVDSPMPTQLVSNEELIPRRQTADQKKVEYLIGEMSEQKSKKLGMERRTRGAACRDPVGGAVALGSSS